MYHKYRAIDGFSSSRVKVCECLCVCVPSKHVKKLLSGLTKEKGEEAIQSAYNVYSAHWASVPLQEDVKKTVVDIETDFLFLVPTQIALQLHAKHARWVLLIGPWLFFLIGLLVC